MTKQKRIILIGGLIVSIGGIYQCFDLWFWATGDLKSAGITKFPYRLLFLVSTMGALTALTTIGSFLYIRKANLLSIVLLAIGAVPLLLLEGLTGILAIYVRGSFVGFLITLPGIIAVFTLLFACYDSSEKIKIWLN